VREEACSCTPRGRPDLALEQLQKTQELDPHFAHVHWQLGLVYLWKGEFQTAAVEFQTAGRLAPTVTMYKGGLGHVYARAGRTAEARRVLDELNMLSKQRYVSRIDFASVYAGLGEKELAFESLERAYEQHDPRLIVWLRLHPEFDTLRSDSRMEDLFRRVGLPND
jgi:adenylate cyclase